MFRSAWFAPMRGTGRSFGGRPLDSSTGCLILRGEEGEGTYTEMSGEVGKCKIFLKGDFMVGEK